MNWRAIVWRWLKTKEAEANLADYLIVLLTAGIVFWARLQWREMDKAGKQTDRTLAILELQQRPFVGVSYDCLAPAKEFTLRPSLFKSCELSKPKVFDVVSVGEQITSKVVVANTGHSPAYNAQLMAHWCLSPKMDNDPPSFEECKGGWDSDRARSRGPRPLFPAGGDASLEVNLEFSLNSAELKAIRESKERFFFIGKVVYGLVRDSPAHNGTDFCFFYAPSLPDPYPYRYCAGGQNLR